MCLRTWTHNGRVMDAHACRLKALDNTTKVLRQSAKAPQRAPSVSGIGAVVEKPDYSEAKIVVAMVSTVIHAEVVLHETDDTGRSTSQREIIPQ